MSLKPPSLSILNCTKGFIVLTSIELPIGYNANPKSGTFLHPGDQEQIIAGNGISPHRNIEIKTTFINDKFESGSIDLNAPLVGSHQFQTSGNYHFNISNSGANQYLVSIHDK